MAGVQLRGALRDLDALFTSGAAVGLADAELLARFAGRRDGAAFAALVARHGPTVLGVCRGVLRHEHDVEDAFQATFLILARKAETLRRGESLGGWLHRVAYRVAVQAATDSARRRARDERAAVPEAQEPPGRRLWDDTLPVLHEELARLPEKYRAPVVLCELQALTQDQAAGVLGWPPGTVAGRLSRGRDLLRARLARRGVAPAAVALSLSAARQAGASVPEALANAAVAAATGTPLTTLAAVMADAALRGPAPVRLTGALTLALAVGLTAAIAATAAFSAGGKAGQRAVDSAPGTTEGRPAVAAAQSGGEKGPPIAYSGSVLDPRGRPVAGAKVVLLNYANAKLVEPHVRAQSDEGGRFSFEVPRSEFNEAYYERPWRSVDVVAMADGYGLGLGVRPQDGGAWTLRLTEDLPVSGRLLDLQGRPVAGVTVRPMNLSGTVKEDADPMIDRYAHTGAAARVSDDECYYSAVNGLIKPVVTDADGRFRITGLGRERLLGMMVEGPTVETSWEWMVTRRTADIKGPPFRGEPAVTVHGASCEIIAGPTNPVVGVVRDLDTGRPIEGVEVHGNHPRGIGWVRSRTDRDGRFQLVGLPAGRPARLMAVGPGDQPYVRATKTVANALGPHPTEVEIGLKRGVWVGGKVTDRSSGRPARGQVFYFAFKDNPHARKVPGYGSDPNDHLVYTAADGAYRLVGLPGPGLVAFQANDRSAFCTGVGAGTIPGRRDGYFNTYPSLCLPINFNALGPVNPPDGAAAATCDLAVDSGRTVKVTVLDPDGRPLPGAITLGAGGESAADDWPLKPRPGPEFEVIRLEAGQERTVTLLHDTRKLAAGLTLRGDKPGPVTVRLKPWGVVTGRLVDARVEPGGGLEITGMDRPRLDPVSGGLGPAVPVGDDGHFRIEGLVPGRRYTFWVRDRRGYGIGTVASGLVVDPGESRDLGDVRVR